MRDTDRHESLAIFGATLEAKPGAYEMSILSKSVDGTRKGAYKEDRVLPDIPAAGKPGPSVLAEMTATTGILDAGPVPSGSGDPPPDFLPLIVQAFESDQEILALTPYCRPRKKARAGGAAADPPGTGRILAASEEGEPAPVAVLDLRSWETGEGCGLLWARIEASSLAPGHYLYALEGREKDEPLEFTVLR
jgi:hypothetical protein